jgi:surface antigen
MDGGHFGNANTWDDNARKLGYTVNNIPAPGAVAQSDHIGSVGHVAWVAAVSNGMVTIEDYNYSAPGEYGFRTVPASDYQYIHFKDLS